MAYREISRVTRLGEKAPTGLSSTVVVVDILKSVAALHQGAPDQMTFLKSTLAVGLVERGRRLRIQDCMLYCPILFVKSTLNDAAFHS